MAIFSSYVVLSVCPMCEPGRAIWFRAPMAVRDLWNRDTIQAFMWLTT